MIPWTISKCKYPKSLNVHTHTHVHILSYFYLYAVYISLYDLDPKYCTICPDCEYICMYT